jgi:protein SCO1/2
MRRLTAAAVALLLLAFALAAQSGESSLPAGALPRELSDVGLDQKLGGTIPLDAEFRNEANETVTLGGYFNRRPVVLALVYYECPMLCSLELRGLEKALRAMTLNLGGDFDVVTVSFDPGETPALAAEQKKKYVAGYGRDGAQAGWHFLTGGEESIRRLASAVGFRYTYDPATDQFTHVSGIMVLTPEGRISRYFYGVDYSARDLRLGLVEASENQIGTVVDQVLLYCFHYDPLQGKYNLVIMNTLRVFGGLTVLLIAGFILLMLRRDRRAAAGLAPGQGVRA